MAKGVSDRKSSKGIPRKARSGSRKARRIKNLASQPRKKLRHMLKRNSLRDAFNWADKHGSIGLLRELRPEFQKELANG